MDRRGTGTQGLWTDGELVLGICGQTGNWYSGSLDKMLTPPPPPPPPPPLPPPSPATYSHQPGVDRLEDVRLGVVGRRPELVAVKHLHLALVPARPDRLHALAQPDLYVRHVVLLLLHCGQRTATFFTEYRGRQCSSLRTEDGNVLHCGQRMARFFTEYRGWQYSSLRTEDGNVLHCGQRTATFFTAFRGWQCSSLWTEGWQCSSRQTEDGNVLHCGKRTATFFTASRRWQCSSPRREDGRVRQAPVRTANQQRTTPPKCHTV